MLAIESSSQLVVLWVLLGRSPASQKTDRGWLDTGWSRSARLPSKKSHRMEETRTGVEEVTKVVI